MLRGATPRGLLTAVLLASAVAALLGGIPLANWASRIGPPAVGVLAETWRGMTKHIGLDLPYEALRRAIRRAEAGQFGAVKKIFTFE